VGAATIIDALDALLDGDLSRSRVERFTEDERANFVREIARFYSASNPDPQREDDGLIRCSPGGMKLSPWISFSPPPSGKLLSTLLYGDQLIVDCTLGLECTIEASINRQHPGITWEDPDDRDLLPRYAYYVEQYREIAKLIRAGLIVPVPLHRWYAAHLTHSENTRATQTEIFELASDFEKLRARQSSSRGRAHARNGALSVARHTPKDRASCA
jgi:hypothetical protein